MHAQDKYGFKARVFQAKGFDTKQDYQKVHGSDLYITDTDKYDQICKARTLGTHLLAQPSKAEFTHVPVGVAAHVPVHHGRVCYLEHPSNVPALMSQGSTAVEPWDHCTGVCAWLDNPTLLACASGGFTTAAWAFVSMCRWSPSAARWQSWTWTA